MAAFTLLTAAEAQEVNRRLYPDYSDAVRPDPRLRKIAPRADGQTRPVRVNNGASTYFPPVINQDGGSCGSASRIYYMFAYEINAWRRANGKKDENRYPTHFTWLLTNSNSGKETMAAANGIPNMPTYGGATYSKLFGNQDCSQNDFGWMQGYDKWYQAMNNRIERSANFPISVQTEEGRELVKNWIWNHNGDPDWEGVGGICGIGVASGGDWRNIPSSDKNKELGVVGKKYVASWGKSVDHALTIVGYDDEIEFDLDGNGVVGEKSKDEVGAWIIVNSWGSGWCNAGFIYCPYKHAVPVGTSGGYYQPEIYYVRKHYRPLRTLKIKMAYTKRSELCLSAGVSQDTTATEPKTSVEMEHFRYAGDGDNDGVDAETPMLGRWTDGMHHEAMEFGYDVTDLTAGVDVHKPVKYFFVIESKSSANGTGRVEALSFMDYSVDEEGIEFPFDLENGGVEIQTKGKKTIISYIVNGDGMNAPLNVRLHEGTLSWDKPQLGSFSLTGFNVYGDGKLIAQTPASQQSLTNLATANSYSVSARYAALKGEGESSQTAAFSNVWRGTTTTPDATRKFTEGGFTIKNILPEKLQQATIEFWIKPSTCKDYNQQIGPGWGTFLFHTTQKGEAVCGWDLNNRFSTARNTLTSTKWAHVAIVIDGTRMMCYINGELKGECSSASGGLPAMGDLSVGKSGASGISAEIDEFRIWNVARSQTQINQYMYSEIENPTTMPGLLLELTMNEDKDVMIADPMGHEITYIGTPSRAVNYTRKDKRELKADFELPAGDLLTGNAIDFHNLSSGNAINFQWEIDGQSFSIDNPSVVFSNAGDKTVKLTVTDAAGNVADTTRTIKVLAMPVPTVLFNCPETVAVGDRVNLINKTLNGTTYEWSLPGAETTASTATHLATTYAQPGRYAITLTARNASGESSLTREIQVNDLWPVADFTVSPNLAMVNTTVRFTDTSLRSPRTWHWEMTSNDTVLTKKFKNGNVTFKKPGVFDITLVAANAKGANQVMKPRALIVCNDDGQTGLNFTGKATEYVTITNPISSRKFTVEYWLYGKEQKDFVNQIGGTASDFMIKSDSEGRIIVSVAGQEQRTPAGTLSIGQWHHYAVVFNGQQCTVLKDAKPVSTMSFTALASENQPANIQLGGSEAPMSAIIDELRIWNSALTETKLLTYANNPIRDVAAAQTSDNLALYYQFNQTTGNVQDATSYNHTGTRKGFGPDGDAWNSSTGIFCLSEGTRDDLTASLLTNYKAPFRHTTYSTNTSADAGDTGRYQELETGTQESTWVIENAVEDGPARTEFFVDRDADETLSLMTGSRGFADAVENLKLYQTVHLDAGYYILSVEGYTEKQPAGCYLVAAAGKGLPNVADFANALGVASVSDGQMSFAVREACDVSLGLVCSMTGVHWLSLKAFRLEQRGTNDDWTFTGIEEVLPTNNAATNSAIYDLQGRRTTEPLRGIYIRDGKKILR